MNTTSASLNVTTFCADASKVCGSAPSGISDFDVGGIACHLPHHVRQDAETRDHMQALILGPSRRGPQQRRGHEQYEGDTE